MSFEVTSLYSDRMTFRSISAHWALTSNFAMNVQSRRLDHDMNILQHLHILGG